MRTIRKKSGFFTVQTTYKLPNKAMKHVHQVASAPQQLLRRHCTRTMCLIQCINFFVNDIILRSLFWQAGNPFPLDGLQKQWRIPHVWDVLQLRKGSGEQPAHLGWNAHAMTRLRCYCAAANQPSTHWFHNSTGNEPVNQVLEKYAWNCSIAVLSVCCWCSDVAKVWTSSDGKKAKAMWVWIFTKFRL